MVHENRVPHAMLFCGPNGCGKMALATAFGCHLLGNGPMLKKLQHPDLHFTYPTIKLPSMGEHQPVSSDFATEWNDMILRSPYFTMDQWMTAMGAANQQAIITGAESDELSRKLSLKSSQGGYKVSIIWLPERMNQTSANKLLKLLEEPPQQTVFIMVSEAPSAKLRNNSWTPYAVAPNASTSDALPQKTYNRLSSPSVDWKKKMPDAWLDWPTATG